MLITLKENEQLIKIVRRYGLTYFWQSALIFILIVAPFFFMFLFFSWGWGGIILFAASLSLGLLFLIRLLYFWYRNVLIITTERVVDIYQAGSLNQTVTEINYDKIHNVSYQIKGVCPTIFRYGTVKIQTAPGGVDIEFKRVKKPGLVQTLLGQAREAFLSRQQTSIGLETVAAVAQKIRTWPKEDLEILLKEVQNRLNL